MRLLLDTHIAVWAVSASDRLSVRGRELLSAQDNTIYVSAVSVWEIAIKTASGKRGAPPFGATQAIAMFNEAGYAPLSVTATHAATVETLPLLHRDPFDRLLVAQAFAEPMYLLTRDHEVAAYSRDIFLV